MHQSPTVFLIDDDTDDQEIFSIAVSDVKNAAKCVFANDGLFALEKINSDENFKPDVIFIDMNMPRMNGMQCLKEIKKIPRLKHIPVYMYSTSAEPGIVEENKKLGAEDFIIKPSDITVLSDILAKIFQKQLLVVLFCICWLCTIPRFSIAQTDSIPKVKELKQLSVEQLMDIMVTTVSKSPEKLSEVASAIQVITSDDIKRSTATRLPDVLRLAPNLQVAQSGSHDWGITSRGFNGYPVQSTSLANKLLMTIDGRTVYTPLFGGVFWDVQNVLLEDVEQIEVVSGPGGSLWGANAVNGIVNVTSKPAKETQGLYMSMTGGTLLKGYDAVRYGAQVDSAFAYRVYAQRYNYNNTTYPGGVDAMDAWNLNQGGFRMDYKPSKKNNFTLQGDIYWGKEDDTSSTIVDGQNLIGRWTHTFSNKSDMVVQAYFDRTYRNIQVSEIKDILNTFDIDMHHNITFGKRNFIVWGMGIRVADDNIISIADDYSPSHRTLMLYSGFVQDRFSIIPQKLDVTIGSKFLINDYTGFEAQPSIRFAFTPNTNNTLWAAASRAVRTPTRFDSDLITISSDSEDDFKSEKVNAFEIGYRMKPLERLSFSLAGYYNLYTDLRSIDSNSTPPPTYYFGNSMEATTYGIEFSANIIATDWWTLRGGYSYLHEEFSYTKTSLYPQSNLFEAIDPKNQFLVQSKMTILKQFELDGIVRYVDVLPIGLDGTYVPSYITFDIRVAWQYKWFTLSASGLNLSDKYHVEFGRREIPRRFMGNITVRF